MVRVLGHELNNSLAPIKSIAGSLESILSRDPRPEDWEADTRKGLAVIAARSEALSRFMSAYARLAKLPRPTMTAGGGRRSWCAVSHGWRRALRRRLCRGRMS